MTKIDFKQELKKLYQVPSNVVVQVDVPAMNLLMVDGQGDPNTSQDYADAVEALFLVANMLKQTVKKGALGLDYVVMPLECMWWADAMENYAAGEKSLWKWMAMIMPPPFITSARVYGAIAELQKKENVFCGKQSALEKICRRQVCADFAHRSNLARGGRRLKKCSSSFRPAVGSVESATKSI